MSIDHYDKRFGIVITTCCLLGWAGVAQADNQCKIASGNQIVKSNTHLAEVLVIRYRNAGYARTLHGFLASDENQRCRLSFYWLDPISIHDQFDHLGYSDFLFTKDHISACLNHALRGTKRYVTFNLKEDDLEFYFPQKDELATLLRSVFSGVRHNGTHMEMPAEMWEMPRFFRNSRGQEDDICHVSDNSKGSYELESLGLASGDEKRLHGMSQNRAFQKKAHPDGTIMWQLSASEGDRVLVKVIVKPCASKIVTDCSECYDPNSLGKWSVIPQLYRDYWEYLRRYNRLRQETQNSERAGRLCKEIEQYLSRPLPDKVLLAAYSLRFKVSLLVGDKIKLEHAALDYHRAYAELGQRPSDKVLIELARIVKELRKHRSDDKAYAWVRPLVASMIGPSLFNDPSYLRELISCLRLQGDDGYIELVLREAIRKECENSEVLTSLANDFRTRYLARTVTRPDPNHYTESMHDLIRVAQGQSPQGGCSLGELQYLLKQSLEAGMSENINTLSETTILELIQRIAADGPYVIEENKLGTSLTVMVEQYINLKARPSEIQTALATLVSLSFYDTSTSEDHNKLIAQLQEISDELQSNVGCLLGKSEYRGLVQPALVSKVFDQVLRQNLYRVKDPLWPMFKFALTENEEQRVLNTAKLMLFRIEQNLPHLVSQSKKRGSISQGTQRLEADIEKCANEIYAGLIKIRSPQTVVKQNSKTASPALMEMREQVFEDKQSKPLTSNDIIWFFLGHRAD